MVAVKAHEVDRTIGQISADSQVRIYLVYGPDTGLVSERADELAVKTGVDLKDPFATIRLNADDVAGDKSRLLDEAFTIGMFGGQRLIRVSGTTRRNLIEAIKPVLVSPPTDAWIIIESGDLNNKSSLRTTIEKSKSGYCLPCYQDDMKMVEQLIKQELVDSKITVSREVVEMLKPFLGGDRLASRNELEKLALYVGEGNEVTGEHVRDIVGDAAAFTIGDIIDAVTAGNEKSLNNNLNRLLDEGLPADMLLVNVHRHFQLLHELRGKMMAGGISAKAVVDGYRPPIFYKKRPLITNAVSKLDIKIINSVLSRLYAASFQARANRELARAIAGTNLLAATLELKSALSRSSSLRSYAS